MPPSLIWRSSRPPHERTLFAKALVAKRGAMAAHIIRALQDLGVCRVAVYSEADAAAGYVAEADEAYAIDPAPARGSYDGRPGSGDSTRVAIPVTALLVEPARALAEPVRASIMPINEKQFSARRLLGHCAWNDRRPRIGLRWSRPCGDARLA
jgi:hypothetical protein